MLVFGLSPDQAHELAAHLSPILQDELLYAAIAQIDHAYWNALMERSRPARDSQAAEAERRRFRAVATSATELLFALNDTRPVFGTEGIDFDALQETLLRVAASASIHSAPADRPRHRPALAWRDELVAAVCAPYPEETTIATIAATVELLLGWLSADVQDVRSIVVDARRRRPEPHGTVTLTRPIRPGFQAATRADRQAAAEAIGRALRARPQVDEES
ncbi:MAG: hypothetical protein AB7Q29_11580 [Vicinamibacterales bacterium]